jgi:hypothetical protein
MKEVCKSWNFQCQHFFIKEKECKKNVVDCCCMNGYLSRLKWLKSIECKLDKCACNKAAKYGHLDCLKYAHENGCEWDGMTCSYAAFYGHLDCLKYVQENGYSWNKLFS